MFICVVVFCVLCVFRVLILEEEARKSSCGSGFVHTGCEGECFICCVWGFSLELWQIHHHIYYPLSPWLACNRLGLPCHREKIGEGISSAPVNSGAASHTDLFQRNPSPSLSNTHVHTKKKEKKKKGVDIGAVQQSSCLPVQYHACLILWPPCCSPRCG